MYPKIRQSSGSFSHLLFQSPENGVYKTLATAAKMARGQMVHYIITNRISDFEKLKEFDTDGYFYEPSLSSDSEFVFLQR